MESLGVFGRVKVLVGLAPVSPTSSKAVKDLAEGMIHDSPNVSAATAIGIATEKLSNVSVSVNLMVFTPTTPPLLEINGPPLFPGRIVALLTM